MTLLSLTAGFFVGGRKHFQFLAGKSNICHYYLPEVMGILDGDNTAFFVVGGNTLLSCFRR